MVIFFQLRVMKKKQLLFCIFKGSKHQLMILGFNIILVSNIHFS